MKKHTASPSWLDLSEDRTSFVSVKEKADIVRKIFELCIDGLGSYTIAKQFNRQAVPTFGGSAKWDHSNIDNLLRNRATIGEYQPKSYVGGDKKGVPNGLPISGYYPAVVDERTFLAAQAARQNHLRAGRGRKGKNLSNLFTHIVTCSYCDGPIKFHSNNEYKSLICKKVLDRNGCVRAAWAYRNFESSVLQFLSHPALREAQNTELGQIPELIDELRAQQHDNSLDVRTALAMEMRKAAIQISLSNAGESPKSIHERAIIRRDLPARFFMIKLGRGRSFIGRPIF
jgi:hypothetical protein